MLFKTNIGPLLPCVRCQQIMHSARKIALLAAFGVLVNLLTLAGDYTWPERGDNTIAFPKGKDCGKILHDRFVNASTNILGTSADVEAIKKAVTTHKPKANSEVKEIRWLSSSLVMARVRLPESEWYYVIEKKNARWNMLTYYLVWIS